VTVPRQTRFRRCKKTLLGFEEKGEKEKKYSLFETEGDFHGFGASPEVH
jgi:hypothetical protein